MDQVQPRSTKYSLEDSRLDLKTSFSSSSLPMAYHAAPWPVNMKVRPGAVPEERTGLEHKSCRSVVSFKDPSTTKYDFQGNLVRLEASVYARSPI